MLNELTTYPKSVYDWVYFTTMSEFEEMLSEKHKIIKNLAYVSGDDDSARHRHRRIFGEVISVPIALSNTKIGEEYEGSPAPRKNHSHEECMKMITHGFKVNGREDNYITPFKPRNILLSSLKEKMDVKVGDRVYFDYATLDKENFLGTCKGKKVFKVRYDDVICIVRDWTEEEIEENAAGLQKHMNASNKKDFTLEEVKEEIRKHYKRTIMQAGWVLVHPEMERWEEHMARFGIVTKSKLDPKPLRGIIQYIGKSDYGLKKHDKIAYIQDADWINTIEGNEYYVMKEKDILGIFTD